MPADTSDHPSDHLARRRPVLDAWREAFVLELRSRDVSGARIGDALAEVDTHCAETGQSAEAAFGEPEVYAADLADSLPTHDRVAPVAPWGLVASGLAIFSGVVLLLAGLGGVLEHRDVGYSYGALLGLGTVTALCVVVVANCSSLLRPSRRFALPALLTAGFLLPVVTGVLAPEPAVTVPAWPTAVGGLVLLCIGGGALSRGGPDLVVDPRTGSEALGTPRWVTGLGRALLPALLLVGLALYMLALLVLALVSP